MNATTPGKAPRAGRVVEFTLPFVLPSLNVQLRSHWAKRRKLKRRCLIEILAALPAGARTKAPMAYCTVRIVHYGRTRDQDNLVGGVAKILLDALKVDGGLGLIADDSQRVVKELTLIPMRAGHAGPRTSIRICEL